MPSGKTHDQVTWFSALPVALGAWLLTENLTLTALAAASFVFAGLMFSGDLDLKSVQYKRWGWLRWIWIPYQKSIPHRSPFSHGPVLGMLIRMIYLSAWLLLGFWLFTRLALWLEQAALAEQSFAAVSQVLNALRSRPEWAVAIIAGLWLGALSHTLADESVSLLKRWLKRWRKPRRKKQKSKKTAAARRGQKRQ